MRPTYRWLQRLALGLTLTMIFSTASADVLVGSWNIRHMGWNNDKDFNRLSYITKHFDAMAIQELMDDDALARLEKQVEAKTGESWSSMASHAIGRGSYKEHYGFLWRDSKVAYTGGAVVFLDRGDVFAREPFSARFQDRATGKEFVMATVHVLYGDGVSDRLPELDALADYWGWLAETYPDTPRMLMGDFNMTPDHAGWDDLRQQGASPVITRGATTLGKAKGRYVNLYDNIWLTDDKLNITDRGILRFPDWLGINHVTARKHVSDHAPVYVGLDGAKLARKKPSGKVAGTVPATPARQCIDLNKATAKVLDRLPNIGPARAQAIIQGRPWDGVGSLTRIRGLGPGRVGDIRDSGMTCSAPAS